MFIYSLIPFLAQTRSLEDAGISFGWLFVKTLVAMIIVIVLAFVFIRYIMPRLHWGRGLRKGSNITILERQALEARKHLYLVRVGRKTVLIGTADQRISKIMDVETEEIEN